MPQALKVGSLVTNPRKPEWGPGKVVRVRGNMVDVFFRHVEGDRALKFKVDALELASVQSDPVLDNLPEIRERNGAMVLLRARITLAQARDRFLRHYPGGFSDPAYIGTETEGERAYKWSAHERFLQELGGAKGPQLLSGDGTVDFVAEIGRILGSASNLLATTEYIALREGLEDAPAASHYLSTLFDLIDAGPEEELFIAHAQATAALPSRGQTHTDKWTVSTILPYLARPDAFIFVKPTITKAAAAALGFDIRYDAQPNWRTYERVLRMSRLYMEELADLGPRDFIDIQSFFWVTGESFEKILAEHQAKKGRSPGA